MATKEEAAPAEEKKQPKASEAKKITKKTESAAEIDTVQAKRTVPVKRKKKKTEVKKPLAKKTKKAKKRPKARDVGIDIEAPMKECDDPNCPFHGTLSARGFIWDVQVVSKRMDRTVVVMRERRHYIQKYQRFEKRTSRFFAHKPPCIDIEVGDMVKVMECRPLSKGTNMVVLGRI
ncbi:MAG: 30S ribosomal protein S17 [Thermoplasmatota archaeon]